MAETGLDDLHRLTVADQEAGEIVAEVVEPRPGSQTGLRHGGAPHSLGEPVATQGLSPFAAEDRSEVAGIERSQVRSHGVDDGGGQRNLAQTCLCFGRSEERCSTLDRDQLLLDSQLATEEVETRHRQTDRRYPEVVSNGTGIVLFRTRKRWWFGIQPFSVEIDRVIVGKIGGGQTERYEVTPGEHSVRVKYRVWVWSNALFVSLSEGEETVLLADTDWAGYPSVRRAEAQDLT
jgi:hypothetical protein